MIRRATLLTVLVAPGCLVVPLADRPPVVEPQREGRTLALHAKAAWVEEGLDDRHLMPLGVLAYRVGLVQDGNSVGGMRTMS